MISNYALERAVRGSSERAAGAREEFAPAARGPGFARPAQRGRWASMKSTAVIAGLFLAAWAHADQPQLFAESKCKKGHEYWFLNRAAAHTDLIGARMLLEGGADVDGKGYQTFIECGGGLEYSSPLFVAVFVVANEAMNGDPKRRDRQHVLSTGMEMVELLLKSGANPNIKEGEGLTPLDIAKTFKHEPTINMLQQYGAT